MILIKNSDSEKFYYFSPIDFTLKRTNDKGVNEGKLFVIQNTRYVLWRNDISLILQSKSFKVDVNDCSFQYKESKFFSHLVINDGKVGIRLKRRKSIWELLNLSTYDELEKIEDNKLYYLHDIILRYKNARSDEEKRDVLLSV
jgi:hypothetical protein